MNVIILLAPLLTFQFFTTSQCANILGVFPSPLYSHFILGQALMKELANRGHRVTVISAYRPKIEPKNYKTILTDDIFANLSSRNFFDLENTSLFKTMMSTHRFGSEITKLTLANHRVQKLLHSKEKFDLVLVEHFYNDALKSLANHFRAPLVLFSSMGAMEWNMEYMGIPFNPSINAPCRASYTNDMNFFQRIQNMIFIVYNHLYRRLVIDPQQQDYMRKYISPKLDFHKIINNASLMLLNSHVTTSENALLQYNVVEIGGFHIVNDKLSDGVQDYLDKATDGAIFFSLGSNLKSSELPQETIKVVFKVFGRLKQKILWKFEKDLPDKPPNLYISKWFEQMSILAHPNVKLFITHGGLLSVSEAIHNGVPMVGIPVFGDQKLNMARAENNGIARIVSLSKISEETLFRVINETLNDPSYQDNMKRMSGLFKDRPIKPLNLAMYWIEYVIRNKGFHFEGPSTNLYWFQLYMLDISLCAIFIAIFFPLILFLFRKITMNTKINVKNKTD